MKKLIFTLILTQSCFAMDNSIVEQASKNKSDFEERIKLYSDTSKRNITKHDQTINKVEQVINSEAYLARKNELSQKIALDLGLTTEEVKKEVKKPDKTPLPEGLMPIIFISKSMPEEVIHRYAQDLHKLGGTMILRGTLGGISKIKPTFEFISKISKVDMACIDTTEFTCERFNIEVKIDPKRFEINSIKSVPALIFEKSYASKFYCETGDPKQSNHVIYGDSSLEGLITALYQLSNDPDLELPLNILRGNTFQGRQQL